MRAIIYVRLSHDTVASTSIERQIDACRAFCEARGWTVVLVVEDVDVSAGKSGLKRAGLDKARALFADADVLVFYKVDRLARSLFDFVTFNRECDAADVSLVSATEPLDMTCAMGRAMAQIIAIFAELEAAAISARVTSSSKHLRAVGRYHGGRVPYGFCAVKVPDGPGYRFEIDPSQEQIVCEIVDRVLNTESVGSIARDLTRRRVPRPGGAYRRNADAGTAHVWDTSSIIKLLRNPALIGRTVFKGQVMRGEDGLPVIHHPPILEFAKWQSLQTTLDRNSNPRTRLTSGSKRLLAKMMICAHCKTTMSGHRSGRRGAVPSYYCRGKDLGLACPGVAIAATQLEQYIRTQFLDRVGSRYVTRESVAVSADNEITEARARIEESLADLDKDRYERGLFRGDRGAAEYAAHRDRLEIARAELDAMMHTSSAGSRMYETNETFTEAWIDSDVPTRNALLRTRIAEIRVSKAESRGQPILDVGRVDIVWVDDIPTP